MSGAEFNDYLAEHLREDVWQGQVIGALCEAGFRRELIYHTWRSDHSTKGFPDIFAIRIRDDGITVVIAELKRWGFEPTGPQWLWLHAFAAIRDLINGRYPNLRLVVGWYQPKQLEEIKGLVA